MRWRSDPSEPRESYRRGSGWDRAPPLLWGKEFVAVVGCQDDRFLASVAAGVDEGDNRQLVIKVRA